VIANTNADVVSMQEVENCDILKRLINILNDLGAEGYAPYLIKGTDTATGQNTAFISRIDPISNLQRTEERWAYPIAGNTCGSTTASGTSGVSKHYWADFIIGGKYIRMFGQHLLAYPTDPPRCVQREAQVSVMRDQINDALALNYEVILFGDFNDYSDQVPDVANDVPTSRVMQILRQGLINGVHNESSMALQSNLKAAASLVEISANIPQAQRYTSAYDTNKLSQIDHILMTSGLAANVVNTFISHSYEREIVSDHWPLIVDISTPQ
jgi:endonuclease/exonuclease/phosphatase family metal-dependent hydrolase